jgi:hypothetical protein
MKNKTTMLLLPFVAGAIIGAAIVWMLGNCCCKTSCSTQDDNLTTDTTRIRQIKVGIANKYFKNYLEHFDRVDTFKAFSITPDQFTAMKMIAKGDTSVHGFRIYMGMIDSLTPVRMVVGTGSPDKVNAIYTTNALGAGPCPWVCDKASPIMAR